MDGGRNILTDYLMILQINVDYNPSHFNAEENLSLIWTKQHSKSDILGLPRLAQKNPCTFSLGFFNQFSGSPDPSCKKSDYQKPSWWKVHRQVPWLTIPAKSSLLITPTKAPASRETILYISDQSFSQWISQSSICWCLMEQKYLQSSSVQILEPKIHEVK